MARYIDADAMCADLETVNPDYKYMVDWAIRETKAQPTIDAVEVVRCKDCKFHDGEEPGGVWCPNVVGSWMAEDGFCSMGERREDETN